MATADLFRSHPSSQPPTAVAFNPSRYPLNSTSDQVRLLTGQESSTSPQPRPRLATLQKKTKNRSTLKSCVCSGSTAMPLKALQPDVSWWFSACCCLAEITASGLQAHKFTRALRLLRNWREKHPSPSEREDASTLLLPTAPPAHTHIRCLPPTSLRLCT